MTITYQGDGKFKIKCKEGIIETGEHIKINNFEITGPGEYEVAGLSVEMLPGIGMIYAEDMNIVYFAKDTLTESELEKVENTDILMIPVDEKMTAKSALEIANKIEPKIIIPMYYKSIDEFTKLEGISPEKLPELKVSKNILPEEERKVVVLNAEP